jgi:hypothetical protein
LNCLATRCSTERAHAPWCPFRLLIPVVRCFALLDRGMCRDHRQSCISLCPCSACRTMPMPLPLRRPYFPKPTPGGRPSVHWCSARQSRTIGRGDANSAHAKSWRRRRATMRRSLAQRTFVSTTRPPFAHWSPLCNRLTAQLARLHLLRPPPPPLRTLWAAAAWTPLRQQPHRHHH